MIIHTHTHCDS